jgi:hypothetical protein
MFQGLAERLHSSDSTLWFYCEHNTGLTVLISVHYIDRCWLYYNIFMFGRLRVCLLFGLLQSATSAFVEYAAYNVFSVSTDVSFAIFRVRQLHCVVQLLENNLRGVFPNSEVIYWTSTTKLRRQIDLTASRVANQTVLFKRWHSLDFVSLKITCPAVSLTSENIISSREHTKQNNTLLLRMSENTVLTVQASRNSGVLYGSMEFSHWCLDDFNIDNTACF